MSEELAERLNNWAMDAFEGRSLIGAVQDISEGARVVSDAARIERNRDMWKGQCERQATELTTLRAENELMREAVKVADDAINEMFRYFDGGETRGSYDGKPERAQLRKAGHVTRNALAQVAK